MSVATITSRRAISMPQMAQKINAGLSTTWLLARTDPDFPKLFKVGPRMTRLFEDEADAYLNKLAAKTRSMQAA